MSSSWNFPSWSEPSLAEPSRAGKVASRAELGHLNFRAEISQADFKYINKKQIFTT